MENNNIGVNGIIVMMIMELTFLLLPNVTNPSNLPSLFPLPIQDLLLSQKYNSLDQISTFPNFLNIETFIRVWEGWLKSVV